MSLFKSWLNRSFPDNTLFVMKVNYIIQHLDKYDKHKVFSHNAWQEKKESNVIYDLEKGRNPKHFKPVRLVLHKTRHKFRVEDGVSRLRAFKRRNISKIRVLLRIGEW